MLAFCETRVTFSFHNFRFILCCVISLSSATFLSFELNTQINWNLLFAFWKVRSWGGLLIEKNSCILSFGHLVNSLHFIFVSFCLALLLLLLNCECGFFSLSQCIYCSIYSLLDFKWNRKKNEQWPKNEWIVEFELLACCTKHCYRQKNTAAADEEEEDWKREIVEQKEAMAQRKLNNTYTKHSER